MEVKLYLSKANDDGTYSDPVEWDGVKEITISEPATDETNYIPMKVNESWEGHFCFDMSYKQHKELAWAILNLKRCTKKLIFKDWKGGKK